MKSHKEKPCCTECGLCCILQEDDEVYCDLETADIKKIPAKLRKYVLGDSTTCTTALATKQKKVKMGALKGYDVCACVMLDGDPLHKCSCKIYENRPATCKQAIKPGDKACRRLIRLFENFTQK